MEPGEFKSFSISSGADCVPPPVPCFWVGAAGAALPSTGSGSLSVGENAGYRARQILVEIEFRDIEGRLDAGPHPAGRHLDRTFRGGAIEAKLGIRKIRDVAARFEHPLDGQRTEP